MFNFILRNFFGVYPKKEESFDPVKEDQIDPNLKIVTKETKESQKAYFEIDNTNLNQFFVGKDPAYPFDDDNGNNYPDSPQNLNPLPETDLSEFGYNVSVICQTHYIPADKVQITLERF